MSFILVNYPTQVKNMYLKTLNKTSADILQNNLDKIKIDQTISDKASSEIAKIL
jgi:hypothetical protein